MLFNYVLEKYPDEINWNEISLNKKSIPFLKHKLSKQFLRKKNLWHNILVEDIALEYLKNIQINIPFNDEEIYRLTDNFDKIKWKYMNEYNFTIYDIEYILEYNNIPKPIKKRNFSINWNLLSSNTSALELIEYKYKTKSLRSLNSKDTISWHDLSGNSGMIPLLEKHLNKINWRYLSKNKNASHLLEERHKKFLSGEADTDIEWSYINGNSGTLELLKKYPEKINWFYLSKNKNALDMLKNKHKDFINGVSDEDINWYRLCDNRNPDIVEMLETKTLKDFHWDRLVTNHKILPFIKKHEEYKTNGLTPLNKKSIDIFGEEMIDKYLENDTLSIVECLVMKCNYKFNITKEIIDKKPLYLNIICKNYNLFKKIPWNPNNHIYFKRKERRLIKEYFIIFIQVFPKEMVHHIFYFL